MLLSGFPRRPRHLRSALPNTLVYGVHKELEMWEGGCPMSALSSATLAFSSTRKNIGFSASGVGMTPG